MPLKQMPLAELVSACRAETGKFLRRESPNNAFCRELFRRAIADSNQAAWDAVVAQYSGLVVAWIKHHPAWPSVREDEDYWVNRAFERFWLAVGPEQFPAFHHLGALLRYLQLCAHSVLMDEVRRRSVVTVEPLAPQAAGADAGPDIERLALGELAERELWRAIADEVQDEAERLVAYLCFAAEWKPREVHQRYPDQFRSVADVYRVKRNLVDRLRRSPQIREFLR